ncbi:DUF6069 family protein [Actinomadura fulvescens]|uniref:Integral membrane protein n=1 Tax=Actinomadura fulvescens TaxID=46160 RepID=A0ABN3PHY3_9ACTN
MGETPFGPFFDGRLPRKGGGDRRTPRARSRSWQRSFRCRTSIPPPVDIAPMSRFDEFVALHESLTARPDVEPRRLWACGLGVAFIAAAMVFTWTIILRGLFGVPVPVGGSDLGPEHAAAAYAVCAIVATFQATALLHLMIMVAARPLRAFCAMAGLAVLVVSLLPLTFRGPLGIAAATGGLNLVGGSVIVTLLATVTAISLRRREPPPSPPSAWPPRLPRGW